MIAKLFCTAIVLAFVLPAIASLRATEPQKISEEALRSGVERSLPLLERASAGSADQRVCFTCHNQALPVFALVEARIRGFHTDVANVQRQVEHTYAHLKRGMTGYKEGKGQGGAVDTAGYALWTLEDGMRKSDEVTQTVVDYILQKQNDEGFWKHTSNRPPSEASSFTTTYLALRAMTAFGRDEDAARIQQAKAQAVRWLAQTQPVDTEDRVFRLLATQYVDLTKETVDSMAATLTGAQRNDGGWSQLDSLESDAYATGTVMYALHRWGMSIDDPAWRKGLSFLLGKQQTDGSWHVASRSKPFQTYFESGFPHGKDQFISTAASSWATLCLLMALPPRDPPRIETLAGTKPIDWPEQDLSGRLMFGAHRFVEREIERADKARHQLRLADDAQRQAARASLSEITGVVETRLPPRLERYGDDTNPALVAHTDRFEVYQVRWPVIANVWGEGLYVRQMGQAIGSCVVVPDATQTPEQLMGLAEGIEPSQQIANRFAAAGFDLVIPTIVGRDLLVTEDQRRRRAEMTNREWIYRQSFHMGRHIIGYEIQRVLAAVDWFSSRGSKESKISVAGYGEGGLVAMHAAALDERIAATLVSGYFDSTERAWAEPIYRNVWRRSLAHGNAEVASLVLPRSLAIEHSQFPSVTGHKGEIATPDIDRVRREFNLIRKIAGAPAPVLVVGEKDVLVGPWSELAVGGFVKQFGVDEVTSSKAIQLVDARKDPVAEIAARKQRSIEQLEQHVQELVQRSEHVRDDSFLYKIMPEFTQQRWSTARRHDTAGPEKFIHAANEFRDRFYRQAMGKFESPLAPPNPRTRKILETDKWTAFDVVLDVHPPLIAWGTLLVPKGISAEERRPVVVCQHGRQGIPRDTIDANNPAYNNFAAELANRGFITFAPHNLYRGEDEYRWLDRKANAIGCTLFSFIIASHDQILQWLSAQPMVDPQRIAFYGLSYGGETAVRVPSILEKYCLSICSGDFNQWTRKVAATDQPFSFMNTIEWEMPYWNLGQTFDYAEMAYLIFPRPFMVERGHNDLVGRDQWVAHEYAKVRWLYAQFGLQDRTAIEFFQGGHSINGVETFEFLHHHLNWPASKSLSP